MSIFSRLLRPVRAAEPELQRVGPLRRAERIALGSGGLDQDPGWVGTDRDDLDITERAAFARLWKPGSRLAFLAEHVWEHLTPAQATAASAHCFEFLRPGGRLRLAVPDGNFPSASYIEHVRPGGSGPGADDHKVLWTRRSLAAMLAGVGFDVRPLEWWDDNGVFQAEPWSPADGKIVRSKAFDPRNQAGELAYTSLILDGIKPLR